MSDIVRLIVADALPPVESEDRLGGVTHGVIAKAIAKTALEIPADQFAAQLEVVIGAVQAIAGRVKAEVAEYGVDEITIGIAVTGEGSVGVATAGVEASIEVRLKRRV
ncbi:MAG: hypothetical protein IBJ03_05435 [Gemmatimonadaceae bacterium]|nr:hypothetical protein [Gemmatimonadaceae bacterium]